MTHGDEESPGKEGKKNDQKEIADVLNMTHFGMHMCNSTTKPVFVVLFFGIISFHFIMLKASVITLCEQWGKGII
jgi:hypothetical protein